MSSVRIANHDTGSAGVGKRKEALSVVFSNGDLSPATERKLESCAKAIEKARAITVASIFEIASQLEIARDELANHGDGRFEKWVKDCCGFTARTARNYLSVKDAFDGDSETVSESFDASALYLLSRDTTPEEAVADAMKAAKSGEHITRSKAREFIETYTVEEESDDDPLPEAAVDDGDDDEWSPAGCLMELRPQVAKWAKRCPETDVPELAQMLRALADQVERGNWLER